MSWRMRTVNPVLPDEMAVRDGLAYSLWLPPERVELRGGIVVLHGAGSCKENHHDFARSAVAHGFAALAFDQRGHGESAGPMDDRAIQDVVAMVGLLRERMAELPRGRIPQPVPLGLRGSSMGGYLAIVAAAESRAQAVVAICPASAQGLTRGLASGALSFEADRAALEGLLAGHDLHSVVPALPCPLLLLHAEGDEQVPVEHSRELAALARHSLSRLVTVPGGHHRSVQHDPELNALAFRFLGRAFGQGAPG
jgi:alpha-beta hydrolase superfamily lysophospholipase